jgi:hypothetical protein
MSTADPMAAIAELIVDNVSELRINLMAAKEVTTR